MWQVLWSVVLLAAAALDVHQRRIPDWLSVGGAVLAVVWAVLDEPQTAALAMLGGLTALAIWGPVYLLGRRWPGAGAEGAFGLGDVKLGVLVGVVCRWPLAAPALVLALSTGSLAALALLLWQRRRGVYKRTATMAYGPYLALGGLATLWWTWAAERLALASPF